MPLTDAKIKSLRPKEKAYKKSDFDGLYINVAKSGAKLWRMKYRIHGKEKLLSIGRYPEISLREARNIRDDARQQLAKGIDPSQAKQARILNEKREQMNTFRHVAEEYRHKIVTEGRAASTIKKHDWLVGMALKDYGDLPISMISSRQVLMNLKKLEKKKQYETARKMRSTVGAIFRYGIALGHLDNDPTVALRDALIRPKVRHMPALTTWEALRDFWKRLKLYNGRAETRLALTLLTLFAVRPGELRQAQWDEFDFDKRVWNIPAERMKARRAHMVPISDLAMQTLKELQTHTGWGPFLFPAISNSRKPMSENTMNQALRRMGYSRDEVTSHGFRASFSTLANQSTLWHPDAIERALAHVEANAVRRAYDRATHWDERVKIATWWGESLE